MHPSVQNLINIQEKIKNRLIDLKSKKQPKIIAVSKTFGMDKISPLIEYGHLDFGENKVQEAIEKWSNVKLAVKLFDYIHSIDSEKLAKKISDEQQKQNKKVKIFIQVNIGNEEQKSGVNKASVNDLYSYCKTLNLNVIGLMCIPPLEKSPEIFFKEMNILNENLNLKDLSMGMSTDYLDAVKNSATYVRIGSSIFGKRG